jgi:hypothetical protein
MFSLQHERFLSAKVQAGVCDKCRQFHSTVDIQYSYGVYAGVLCEPCARKGYRDQCGFGPGGQGTRAEYEELGGDY